MSVLAIVLPLWGCLSLIGFIVDMGSYKMSQVDWYDSYNELLYSIRKFFWINLFWWLFEGLMKILWLICFPLIIWFKFLAIEFRILDLFKRVE